MKRITYVIIFLLPSILMAQQKLTRQEKKYAKTAQELDVLNLLPDSTDYDPSTFWKCITRNNSKLQKMLALFENPKGLAKDAYNEVEWKKSMVSIENMYYDPKVEGHINNTFHHAILGDNWDGDKITFRVRHENIINAYSTPDGFVYIFEGLMNKVEGNSTMINGALAHEVAHYLFKHMLVHEYMTLKREKSNKIGAAVAILGLAAANAAAAVATGGAAKEEDMEKHYQSIIEGSEERSLAYQYRYGREEEIVSDIIAYRFLEWTGRNPELYITLMGYLNLDNITEKTKRYDDHPSGMERIGVLRALKPAPWTE